MSIKVIEYFKDFLIPRPKLCGQFNQLTYDNYTIIGYPTEIKNENYQRSKIEFNYCLVLKKNTKKKSKHRRIKSKQHNRSRDLENDNEELSIHSDEDDDLEDDPVSKFRPEDTAEFDKEPPGGTSHPAEPFWKEHSRKFSLAGDEGIDEDYRLNHVDYLRKQYIRIENLKTLCSKISKFLTDMELTYSIITEGGDRSTLFCLLDKLFKLITKKEDFTVMLKKEVFSFQFFFRDEERESLGLGRVSAARYFEKLRELKRPLLVCQFSDEEKNSLYERDYLMWLVIDKLDLRCESCEQLVQIILDLPFLRTSKH